MSQQDRRPFSPLVLADYLISLAEYADRGGLPWAARCLIEFAYQVLDGSEPASTDLAVAMSG